VVNEWVYSLAVWIDAQTSSTALHESFYLYNWIETTHVLALTLSLGLLLVIDLRMLGFAVMFLTGMALFYAIPVRSAQSVWFRIKVMLLVAAFINALLFHKHLRNAGSDWDTASKAPVNLRLGAWVSVGCWLLVVICGRLIAYDWFDCAKNPGPLISAFAGCVSGQEQF
jgi:hypothetical protein